MCMPTPSNISGFGYSWGFTSTADLTKCEVETPGSLSYTLGNTVSPETTLTVMSHKTPQVQEKVGTIAVAVTNAATQVTRVATAGTPGTARRAMFVLNDSSTHTMTRLSQPNQTATTQTTHLTAKPFTTSIGPIQLTAEECNEILVKRALQAQGIATPVIDTSQLNHSLLNDSLKSLAEATAQQSQEETIQTTVHQHHLLHSKQEPCTASNSPKTNMMSNTVLTMPSVKERPYSCEECGKSFLLKHHLTTHARVHTGERPHVCGHCGKAFARKHCLNTHLLLHSADRPYRCHECKMAFTLKHHLVTHSRVHSRERPFVCGECGRGFPLKRHLVTHSKYHAGERPFVCGDCGESFAQKEHLVMHSRFHGSLSPFVCPDCGVAFARKFQLVNHGRVHGRVPHACPVCGKEFLQKRTLVAHLKIHTGEGAVACLECGESFTCKSELQQHLKLTSNCRTASQQQQQTLQQQQQQQQQQRQQQAQQQAQQQQQQQQQQQTTVIKQDDFKPQIVQVIGADGQIITEKTTGYACPECGSCFNTKEALSLHVRLHAGDRTCVTDLCALTAALHPGLVHHNQPIQIISSNPSNVVHTQVIATNHHMTTPRPKLHFCVDCGKGFAAKHGLLAHHKRHPDGSCTLRTHVCDQCGKAFFQKNHLMLHQRQHMDLPPRNSQAQQQATQQAQQQAAQQVAQQVQQQMHQQQQQQQQQNQNQVQLQNLELEQQDYQQPTHIQVVTNRSGQVIGNQIVVSTMGGRRALLGSPLHIVSRDGKPLPGHLHKRHHAGDVKEAGGLVLSTGRGTAGLIKYEISISPPTSALQVQQLD